MQEQKKFMAGNSDFLSLQAGGYYYVDKTLLIRELLDHPAMVTLITRPRRFGKTLNMSMLQTFFEMNSGGEAYFRELNIGRCGEKYMKHCGAYPVISLSLKDVKGNDWNSMYGQFCNVIRNEAGRLEAKGMLSGADAVQRIAIEAMISGRADRTVYMNSLQTLAIAVSRTAGKQPIIFIDEYDVPIHEAHEKGYYEEALDFEKTWLSAGLKDNPQLQFAVITGVLRIAKESIFSDLNNLKVYSITSELYAEYFGFTEQEVRDLAEYYGVPDRMDEIQDWYDGYRIGGKEIYNPWSVVNYFAENCQAHAFWSQTSRNAILRSMLRKADEGQQQELRELLEGGSCEKILSDSITYSSLDKNSLESAPSDSVALYTLLVMTGYLKIERILRILSTAYVCEVKLPNREIRSLFADEILDACRELMPVSISTRFDDALVSSDSEKLQKTMREFLLQSTSAHDLAHEVFYQGLLTGLCAVMYENYYLTGNLESGEGRYDIQLKPKHSGQPGILIELKVYSGRKKGGELQEELKSLADLAVNQIETKSYCTELLSCGCSSILLYGMAFKGKKVAVAVKKLEVPTKQ